MQPMTRQEGHPTTPYLGNGDRSRRRPVVRGDVHDVGLYFRAGKPRKLEAGMVITVEPGIYIGKDCEKVEARWRGIGVRIEDDILVTEAGPINLTQAIPKTVAEVEQACRA